MLQALIGGDLEGRVAQAMPTVLPNSLFAPFLWSGGSNKGGGAAIRGVVVVGGGRQIQL